MKKVLFDTNVIVDVLLARGDFAPQALAMLKLAEDHIIKGYVSAASISDIHYIVRRALKDETATMRGIDTILEILHVAKVNKKSILRARKANWADFEDAIQNECAAVNHIPCIVTRNTKDFARSTLFVCTPEDFLLHFATA